MSGHQFVTELLFAGVPLPMCSVASPEKMYGWDHERLVLCGEIQYKNNRQTRVCVIAEILCKLCWLKREVKNR